MITTIIGFSGRKSSGKNTCADVLTDLILDTKLNTYKTLMPEQIIKSYAFADPMKRVCTQFFGLTWNQCYGTNEQKNTETLVQWENFPVAGLAENIGRHGPMTAREVLQYFGTEILRKMEPNAHVRALMWDIVKDSPQFACVTDVRFPNEVAAIKECGGKVIRLTRVVYPNDTHESETALDEENYDWNNFDYILDNESISLEQQLRVLHIVATAWKLLP